MSVFSGTDPDSWLFRVDRYFQIHNLTDSEKMIVAVVSFDGAASNWYRSQEERNEFKDWADLKQRLLVRFQSIREGSICGRFLAIKQESTVEEYRNLFDNKKLVIAPFSVAPLPELPNKVLEKTFMNGLIPWIKAEVECWEPVRLAQMMKLA